MQQAPDGSRARADSDREGVEAPHLARGAVGVRHGKNRSGSILVYGPEVWDAFLNAAQRGMPVRP
ncbi:DUF397 domain-containing protein [Nocardia sp. NPDC050799]|uniref:DUF397 domain-containing protein n=1 Tax=Nocardia sp. NPDC050799 TaxID=3154842 RepID=UPI0033D660A3